ncbi:MAG: holo-ACP synthase [Treponema sp.]|jgi:holo-[acyl-carrier protein] synthase|nr:holo-ACP synthase [Treponema sp.]
MIVGIGIDAVKISRMERWVNDSVLLERFFDPRELDSIRDRGAGMARSLAARFAAKEAFGKALGSGLTGIVLKDIMILSCGDEKPELHLEGSALEAMNAAGSGHAHISLTHEGDMALAFVVLET